MRRSALGLIVTLTLAILTVSLTAEAQHATHVYRIGLLSGILSSAPNPSVEAFRQGLRDLAYVEGQSHNEIAEAVGLARDSVKVLLFRARKRLRDLLEAERITRAR